MTILCGFFLASYSDDHMYLIAYKFLLLQDDDTAL